MKSFLDNFYPTGETKSTVKWWLNSPPLYKPTLFFYSSLNNDYWKQLSDEWNCYKKEKTDGNLVCESGIGSTGR